jgi:ATP-dependent helicase/nuclease subunit B
LPLTLVTGPANAEKAGVVLDAYREQLARGAEPILVVPRFADVEHYRRELADGGAVFGVRVERFRGLVGELARRAGVAGRPLSALARERVAVAAIAATRLGRLAPAARTPGFAKAFVRLMAELEQQRVDPPRFAQALRTWSAGNEARGAFAGELSALAFAYRAVLDRLGRRDEELHAAAALDAIRLEPQRWGATPVLFYGFDDLTPLQQDAVETLARHAAVTLALTFEPGRAAFAARARSHNDLLPLADEVVTLEGRPDHYAHSALHHLERHLFEPAAAQRPDPGDAIAMLEAGGERAEVEQVAAHVARLIRQEGYAPQDIAIVWREPQDAAALTEQVLGAYGIPYALTRRVPLGHTALGRGLIALARCATDERAGADDLLTWLRTPGFLRRAALADDLEQRARREGARTAAAARALWEQAHPTFPLDAIDEVRREAGRGVPALCRRLAREAARLFSAPFAREAPVFSGAEQLDARVAAMARRTLDELGRLAQADAALAGSVEDLLRTLGDLEIFAGDDPGPGRVQIARPQDLRARRVRALFLCGLNEGVFPRPSRPDPFLGDEDRHELNVATGLKLRHHEDTLATERLFFYAAASRPTDLLALSWHTGDDDGRPAVRSFFVDDVAELFAPELMARRERRGLGAAGWAPALAPTAREARRAAAAVAGDATREAQPLGPLCDPEVLGALRERETWSASALETWRACPVRWFVERQLSPRGLEPDPEPLVRGSFVHKALERVYAGLPGGRLGPEELPAARVALREALAGLEEEHRISVDPDRLRAEVRRVEADLIRHLEHAAHDGSVYAARELELVFGQPAEEGSLPAAELGGGELRLAGRIDRLDAGPEGAIVRDYKGRSAVEGADRWLAKGKLQMGLYVRAVQQLLDVGVVGGLYQQIGGEHARPRGFLVGDADAAVTLTRGDRMSAEQAEAVLAEIEAAAVEAVREIRAGRLEPRPETCGWKGDGCSYPSICRCARS